MLILQGDSTFVDSNSTASSSGRSEEDFWTTSGILLPLRGLSFEGCIYRGEGNANIVIALPYERKVVRFRKSRPDEVSSDGGKARVEREVDFLRNVISGFLDTYVQTPQIFRGSQDDITKLSEAIRPLRPESRRNKAVIEEYATKFPDYTFLPPSMNVCRDSGSSKSTFCVEIKPKQGFLHELNRQFQKCSYCLTQYYKLKHGTISTRSKYCPFDLFSGDSDRMRRALRGLLESPQNNLKIFKDGIIVYDQDSYPSDIDHVFAEWFSSTACFTREQYFDKFSSLVCTALLRSFSQERQTIVEYYLRAEKYPNLDPVLRINPEIVSKAKKVLYFAGDECNFANGCLPRGSVLERIIRMQQLPYCNADVVYRIYSKHFNILNNEVIYSNIIEMHRACKDLTEQVSSSKQKQTYFTLKIETTEKNIVSEDEPYEQTALSKNLTFLKRTLQDTNGNEDDKRTPDWVFSNEVRMKSKSVSFIKQRNNNNQYKQEIYNKTRSSLTIDQFQVLQNYLLFSTAKDCSILMAFQEFDPSTITGIPPQHVIKISDELHFAVNIGISDLDPKSVHCIEKHRKRDTDVLNAVIQVLEEELVLRNQRPFENQVHK